MPAQGPLRDGEPAGFALIETLRWEPQAGFLRLERHLARLAASATELGFVHDPAKVAAALDAAVEAASTPLRLRLELAADGDVQVAAHPFTPVRDEVIWTLRLAQTKLDSSDSLLRHKTTRREAYTLARAEYSTAEADEVVLANERGEMCEGTITTLFADFGDGVLVTPRLDCGLLAGMLRAELLEQGKATEAVLTLDDLRRANTLFVGNSLRGLVRARLA